MIGLATLASTPGMAQPLLGVQVIPPAPKTAAPGDFITLVYLVKNRGTTADSYALQVLLPEGLQLIGIAPPALALNSGAEESVFVTILILPTIRAGPNEAQLQAVSRTNPTVQDTGTALLEILPSAGVALQLPPDQKAKPGSLALYLFGVVNRGNTLDIYKISARSSNNFPVVVTPARVQLVPGERAEVRVQLSIPPSAAAGRDLLLFQVRSTLMSDAFAEARVITTVLPLPFQQVPTFLGLELPSIFTLAGGIEPLTPPAFDTFTLHLLSRGEIGESLTLSSELLISLLPAFSTGPFSITLSTEQPSFSLVHSFVSAPTHLSVSWLSASTRLVFAFSEDISLRAYQTAYELGASTVGLLALTDDNQDLLYLDFSSSLELGSGTNLSLEAAGSVGGLAGDSALRMSLALHPTPSFISFDLVLAGTSFGNRASFTGSYSYSLSTISLLLSPGLIFGLEWSNWTDVPGLPHVFSGSLQASALASVEPFGFAASWNIEHTVGDGLSPLDQRASAVSLSADVAVELLSVAFSISRIQLQDNLTMTETDTLQHVLTFSLRPGGGAFFSLQLAKNSVNGVESNEASLNLGVTLQSLEAISSISLDSNAHLGLTTTLVFHLPFTLQLESIAIKGQVEGRVFIDQNGNQRFDPDESGLADLVLTLGETQALSNDQGHFRFPPLKPGNYSLTITDLPPFAEPSLPLPMVVPVQAGKVTVVEIPTRRLSAITGVVFNDSNRNGIREASEAGISNVRLLLQGAEKPEQSITRSDGSFRFSVVPGTYKLLVDSTSLPRGFELTTAGEVSLSVRPSEILTVNFGAVERPRPVRFTPVADFSYKPEHPRPGETVTFDASSSFDPDGTIVRYEWDFNNDGTIDARGVMVAHVFLTAGDFPIKLIVTDNDGLSGTATQTITVKQ